MVDFELRKQNICRDYLSGVLTPELARRYGITRERVRQIIAPHGLIAERKARQKAKKEEKARQKLAQRLAFDKRREDAAELVRAGWSIAEAARLNGVSPPALKPALESKGIKSAHSRHRDVERLNKRIGELAAEGLNGRQIKRQLRAEGLVASLGWIYKNFGEQIYRGNVDALQAQGRIKPPKPANDNHVSANQEAA